MQFTHPAIDANGLPYPPDALTYLAAGERLNAGHALYRLAPGDRPVWINPPYWTVPLLSPPLIAVVWRPLALIGSAAVYGWWAAGILAVLTALVVLMRRRPASVGVLVALLSLPLAIELYTSNLNSVILAAAVLTWILWRRDLVGPAAALVVLLAALKVLPVFLVLWVLAVSWRRAIWPVLLAAAVLLAIELLGAGLEAHLEYLRILLSTAGGGATSLSLAGATGVRGLPMLAAICATVAIVVLRRWPGLSFSIAVAAMAVVTPSVYWNTFTAGR